MQMKYLLITLLASLCLVGIANAAITTPTSFYTWNGNSFTDSLNARNLTNNGTTNVTGKIVDARYYNGTSAYAGGYNGTIGTVTYSMWVNFTNITGFRTLFGFLNSSEAPTNGYVFYQVGGVLGVFANNTLTPTNANVTVGQWYHIVLVRVGDGAAPNGRTIVYINNSVAANYSNGMGTRGQTAHMRFGFGESGLGFHYGSIDAFGIWEGRQLNTSEILDLWNSGAGNEYPFMNSTSNITITANDIYDATGKTNFGVIISNSTTVWCNCITTNGTINTGLFSTDNNLYNLTFYSTNLLTGNFINRSYINYNFSGTATLATNVISSVNVFNATEIISNISVTGFTVTAPNGQSNSTTLYLKGGSPATVNWSKTGWYNASSSITLAALNSTRTISGVYPYLINVTWNNTVTGVLSTTFYVNISSGNYSYIATGNTTNGSILFPWASDWNINISGYNNPTLARTSVLWNTSNYTSGTLINITLGSAATNAIFFNVLNEENGQPITTLSTIYITGTTMSYNLTTTTGMANQTLIVPDDYAITTSAVNYTQRNYYYTLVNQSSNSINIYLVPLVNSSGIAFTLKDQYTNALVGAKAVLSKKNLSGTNSYTVAMCRSDINGLCLTNAELFNTGTNPIYSILFYNSAGTLIGTTGDTQFETTAYTFNLNNVQNALNDFFSQSSLTALIQWLPSSAAPNGTVTLTISDPSLVTTNACLLVTRTTGATTSTISNTCSTTGTAATTITTTVNITTGDSINAEAYIDYSTGSTDNFVTEKSIPSTASLAGLGTTDTALALFMVFGIMITVILISRWTLAGAPFMAGLVFWVFARIGFISVTTSIVMIVITLLGIVLYNSADRT